MPESNSGNWRDLCIAALRSKDPDEVMQILQQLAKALKREEQIRRDFWASAATGKEG